MIDLLGLYIHTTASSHTYNPLYEMVHSASTKGLSLLGCSDHVPAMPGSCHPFHFINFEVPLRILYDVGLMMDVKLNIMDYGGTVDLERSVPEPLDCATASLHQPCIHSGTALQNTDAYLGTPKNSLIHIIGHPDDSRFPIDYDTLVTTAGEHHRLLEVNNSSLNPLGFRMGVENNYIKMLEPCRHYGTSIITDSDAHREADAGNHAFTHALSEEVNFPRELIIDIFLDRLCYFPSRAAVILAQREDERCGHLYRPTTMEKGNAPGGNEL